MYKNIMQSFFKSSRKTSAARLFSTRFLATKLLKKASSQQSSSGQTLRRREDNGTTVS